MSMISLTPEYYSAIRKIVEHLDAISGIIIETKALGDGKAIRESEKDALVAAAVMLQVPYTNFRTEIREQMRQDGELPPFEEELLNMLRSEEA